MFHFSLQKLKIIYKIISGQIFQGRDGIPEAKWLHRNLMYVKYGVILFLKKCAILESMFYETFGAKCLNPLSAFGFFDFKKVENWKTRK